MSELLTPGIWAAQALAKMGLAILEVKDEVDRHNDLENYEESGKCFIELGKMTHSILTRTIEDALKQQAKQYDELVARVRVDSSAF